MTHVLTLIGAPAARSLASETIAAASALLPNASAPRWLAADEACDIPFVAPPDVDILAIAAEIRATLGGTAVDANVLPAANRRKKLLVADMDSTIIGQECIDELADFAGIKPQVAAITERAMRGELAFESALRERVALLAGLDESVLQRVFDERICLTPGARTLTATMRADGAECILVSGGFTFFTGRVAALAGFDHEQANRLEVESGKLAGRVHEPILGRDAKRTALIRHRAQRGLAPHETLAVGDGANDLDMIREAGLGVAFHAKPIIAAEAAARIEHGDLTALLYLQGYAKAEFIEV
jgi:phosphoserine phosphatase